MNLSELILLKDCRTGCSGFFWNNVINFWDYSVKNSKSVKYKTAGSLTRS